eukprot:gene4908-3520_t
MILGGRREDRSEYGQSELELSFSPTFFSKSINERGG